MSKAMAGSLAILTVIAAFTSVRSKDGQVRPIADAEASAIAIPATPAGVVVNGFTIRGVRPPQELAPISGQATNVPLTGATLLLLGKDKVGGNVQLSWTGGTAPYQVNRWSNLIGGGTPAMTTSVNSTSFDDPVLFDGLNESWIVN